jgi:serine/threonine protein kinase
MADELIGKTIGGYEIIDRIGEGGMATVYLAHQQSMNRKVALKVLPRQFMSDDTYLQRFEREVKIVSQLEHRSIIPVHDYGEFEGQPYIAMRYMPAGSVDDLLRHGPINADVILSIVQQIAPALDYAHSKDVLHRDLKPSNVLLDDGGGAYITDFGIARLTGEGNPGITTQGVVGTPAYMSPEQAQGKELDGRSDVYALGVMLFEMATGRRPFESETPYSIAVMQVTQQPPMPRKLNPAISTALESVILKSLKKNRDERYQTANALAEGLKLAIERPTAIHDTEPAIRKMDLRQQQERIQPPAPQPISVQPLYADTSSHPSRPVVQPPPSSLRSQIRKRRQQNPMLSALIGSTIGCGMLGILLAIGFFALSFFIPQSPTIPAPTLTNAAEAVNPGNGTEAPTVPALIDGEPTSTQTLDAISFAARETLLARNTGNDTTATAEAAASLTATLFVPTRTGIDPIGVRGTPALGIPLRPVSGIVVFADARGDNQTLQIVSINLDNWIETQLTDDPDANNSYPIASPDGRWVAFQSDRDGDFDIYIMNRGGGQLQRMTFNEVADRIASWSPDGEWIVYTSDSEGNGTYELRRVSLDGLNDELLFNNGQRIGHPRYSPDSRYIIFTIGADPRNAGTWEIGRLDTETDELVLLTNNDVRDASPVFSPDGQTIMYITFDGSDNAIATMDINGNNQQILYDTSGSDWAASYSPDGQFIVFTSNLDGDDQLYLMTADGRSAQAITSDGGLYGSWIPPRAE